MAPSRPTLQPGPRDPHVATWCAYYRTLANTTHDAVEHDVYELVLHCAHYLQRPPTHHELHQYWREFAWWQPHPWLVVSNAPLGDPSCTSVTSPPPSI